MSAPLAVIAGTCAGRVRARLTVGPRARMRAGSRPRECSRAPHRLDAFVLLEPYRGVARVVREGFKREAVYKLQSATDVSLSRSEPCWAESCRKRTWMSAMRSLSRFLLALAGSSRIQSSVEGMKRRYSFRAPSSVQSHTRRRMAQTRDGRKRPLLSWIRTAVMVWSVRLARNLGECARTLLGRFRESVNGNRQHPEGEGGRRGRGRTEYNLEGLTDQVFVDLDRRVLADVDREVNNVEAFLGRPGARVGPVLVGRQVPARSAQKRERRPATIS